MDNFPFFLIIIVLFFIIRAAAGKKKAGKKSGSTVTQNSSTPRRDAGAGVSSTVYSSPRDTMSGKQHGSDHTHDRLDYDCFTPDESQLQHYKKQLDSFVKAGLIERSEYLILLRRYMNGR